MCVCVCVCVCVEVCVCVCVCVCVFTNPSALTGMWHQNNFKVEFNKLEFRFFFLLDCLSNQG